MTDLSQRRGLPGLSYPEAALHRLADQLAEQFTGILNRETVERYVLESYAALLRTSAVKAHLITNTTRFVKERLTALAQAKGAIARPVPEILFLCEQNAGRSQMAAVLTQALAGDQVHVRSAGSAPAKTLHPEAVDAMAELGLDLGQEFPKPLTDDVVQAADVVVTMGCGDACPIYPGKQYQDWNLTDPSGLGADEVRVIRDQLHTHVTELLASLGVTPITLAGSHA